MVVTQINSKRIYLVGEVLHAGATPMLPNMTVLQALSSAGLNQFANTKRIYVLRTENGKQQKLPVNYRKLVKGEQIEQNYLLQPGIQLLSRKGYSGSARDLRVKSMARMRKIRLALLVFGMSICAAAQNSSQSQPETTPAPAFGQNAPVLNPENPPVSGLDEPGLDLHTASRSFISPALQVSESADTNGGNQFGKTGLDSVTHVLGALDIQQFWPKSDLFLEYLGGGAFYANPYDAKQLQAAGLEAVTRWRTGQVTLRDSFSYLPDGSFQIGFGGDPGLGLISGGLGTGGAGGGLPGTQQSAAVSSVRWETFPGSRTRRFSMRFRLSIRSPRSLWRVDSATLISTTPPKL